MESDERKNPTTEPRKSGAGGTIRMKDVFKSSDTNLLGDVNLSDMNVLSSTNMDQSEPRNYVEEQPVSNPYIGKGITSTVREIPDQEDNEESQYEQSQAIISELDQEQTSENKLFLQLEKNNSQIMNNGPEGSPVANIDVGGDKV
jgi:hypothetical protein